LKPTLGLISGDGIVPISHQQDTAGPMARSVTDVAILLGIMQSSQTDYTPLLQRGALQGKRIGRDVRFFDYSYYGSGIPGDELTVAFANNALSVMQSLGATIVNTDTGDVFAYNGDEFTALLYEFRAQIADYLATLTHTSMRTLADLIAFNDAHCTQEMPYYDQDVFLLAEQFVVIPTIPITSPREHMRRTPRERGLMMRSLETIWMPSSRRTSRTRLARRLGLSKLLDAGGNSLLRQTGRHVDVQHSLPRSAVDRDGLRSRASAECTAAAAVLGSIIPIPNGGFCTGHHNHGQPHLPHGKIF